MSGPARGLSRLSDLHVSPIPGRSGTRARAFESAAAPRGSCRQSTTSWRRQSTFSLHSERRRTRKCPQRWPSISNIADATRLTSDSLLAFLLHSPHPAFVRVIEGTLNVPNGARRIGIDGASEGHQRDCDCQSSGPKNHLVPYRICLPPEIKSHASRSFSVKASPAEPIVSIPTRQHAADGERVPLLQNLIGRPKVDRIAGSNPIYSMFLIARKRM
jgi:hypothetical protein